MANPIGQLKVKATSYCTICCSSYTRKITENIFENTPEEIEKAKQALLAKSSAKYTCRICKSIEKSVNN